MSKGLEALSQPQTRSSLCTGACLHLEGSSEQAAPRSLICNGPLEQEQRRCGWNLRVQHPHPRPLGPP